MKAALGFGLSVAVWSSFVACGGEGGADDAAGGASGGTTSSSGGVASDTGGAPGSGGEIEPGTGGESSTGGSAAGGTGGGTNTYLPDFCDGLATAPVGDQWQTDRVFYENGKLTYTSDGEQNRVPDFSYAGYHYGESPIPDVAVIETVSPVDGDDTATIQAALDRVGALERDEKGLRGAVELAAGTYDIGGQILLNQSGVVLRGAGPGSDAASNSILRITGTSTRTAVRLGSGNGTPWSRGTGVNVTTPFVPVGSKSFDVQSAAVFTVGDEVIVRHPSTQAWIDAVDGGATGSDADWQAGTKDLLWVRRVRGIEGNTLTLDAPLYNQLDGSLTTAVVHPMENKGYRTEIGLENLRIDIQTLGGTDEAHSHDAVGVVGAEDSWVRNVTVLHFMHAGVYTQGAVRITVEDSVAIEPVGIRDGGRFYNFDAESESHLILFTGCEAHDGRHNMIVNGTGSASGIVFHRIDSRGNSSQSEGHRQWSHGMLFDSIFGTEQGQVQLLSRGDYGTGHGWSSAHSVIWSNTGVSRVQKPPTAQNYAFSSVGSLSTSYPFASHGGNGKSDVRTTGDLFPHSLYEAQLCERLLAQ